MAQATVWAVGAAFIVLGLLNYVWAAGGALNWIIAGVVSLLVGWYGHTMK